MSNKLVWSSNMTQDYFMGLNPSEMRAELVDFGYEPEMLDRLDEQGLYDLIAADDSMWQMDSEEFEYNVRPMIEKQTRDGIVLMSGSVGRWTGNHSGGKAVYAEDLVGGDICQDCDEIAIYDVNGVLQWQGCHHDGCHYMNLYALPEDEGKLREFIEVCCPRVIEEETIMGEDGQTDEESLELIVSDFMNGNYDPEWLNDWCDFSKVPEVCEPIIDALNMRESLYKDYNLVHESIEDDEDDGDDDEYEKYRSLKLKDLKSEMRINKNMENKIIRFSLNEIEKLYNLIGEENPDVDIMDDTGDDKNPKIDFFKEYLTVVGLPRVILPENEENREILSRFLSPEVKEKIRNDFNNFLDEQNIPLEFKLSDHSDDHNFDREDTLELIPVGGMGRYELSLKLCVKLISKQHRNESLTEADEEDDDEDYSDTSNFKLISAVNYGDDYYRDIRIIFEYNGQKYCYHDGTSASGWGDNGIQISKEFDLENALHTNGGEDIAWELDDYFIGDLVSYAQKLEADKWHDTITIEEPLGESLNESALDKVKSYVSKYSGKEKDVEESCNEESCTKEKKLGEGKLGKAVNKDKVIIETEQLKDIFNDGNMDEIYSMYLFNPEEEDASFQYVYPNFFKHVLLPYLKEYDLIEVDKLKDSVYIDEITNYWSEGGIPGGDYLINNDDWKRMFHAVDLRVSNDKNIQWDKIPWEDEVPEDVPFEEDLDFEDQPLPDRI